MTSTTGLSHWKSLRFLRNQNIYEMTLTAIDEEGFLRLENGITLKAPACQDVQVGDRIAAVIRAEEVVIIRPNKPIGPELQDNLFQGTLRDILAFGGTHTLTVGIDRFKHKHKCRAAELRHA